MSKMMILSHEENIIQNLPQSDYRSGQFMQSLSFQMIDHYHEWRDFKKEIFSLHPDVNRRLTPENAGELKVRFFCPLVNV